MADLVLKSLWFFFSHDQSRIWATLKLTTILDALAKDHTFLASASDRLRQVHKVLEIRIALLSIFFLKKCSDVIFCFLVLFGHLLHSLAIKFSARHNYIYDHRLITDQKMNMQQNKYVIF